MMVIRRGYEKDKNEENKRQIITENSFCRLNSRYICTTTIDSQPNHLKVCNPRLRLSERP